MKKLILSSVVLGLCCLVPEGNACTVDPISLVPPSNLARSAYSASPKEITLSWQDNSSNEDGFFIEKSNDGGITWVRALSPNPSANTTSAVVPLGTEDNFPLFRVLATVPGDGFSFPSNVISIEGTDPTVADTDGDGMVDAFEATNGLDPYVNDAYQDADGDRYPNIFEYIKGSDVADAQSVPASDIVVDPAVPAAGKIYNTFAAAFGAVNSDNQIIAVKNGTYSGSSNINLNFPSSHPILLISENGAARVILDGQDATRIFTVGTNSVIDGFTFRNGAAATGGSILIQGGSPMWVNCVFLDNTATTSGGAIHQDAGDSLILHSTFARNSAPVGSAIAATVGSVTIDKSILWNSGVSELDVASGVSLTVSESIVRLGYTGTGNLASNPILTEDGHLTLGSPAIDQGGILTTSLIDLDGEARPAGTTTDLGADEYIDADSDGLPDWWEIVRFGVANSVAIGSGDADGDGMSNLQEYQNGTNPNSVDSDGDGMPDNWEVAHGLNPRANDASIDSDGDSYSNLFEYQVGLDPLHGDSKVQISSGDNHSLLLKADGTVWAWGNNGYGQLGDGTVVSRTVPVPVSGLTDVVSMAVETTHVLVVKSDGTVWAWGSNGSGQLGDGTTINRTVPVQVSGLSGVIAVGAGNDYSLAVKSDGTVWAWGSNGSGRLGDGTTVRRAAPVQVSGLSGVIAVETGNSHSLALKSDGTVWAWGSNFAGQLGDGTTINRAVPVQVSGLSGVMAVGGGSGHSLALKSDGTVWAWGSNASGQLGDGTTINRTAPVQASGLSGVIAVEGGGSHSLALKSDGTAWVWGSNYAGQLGDGTTISRAVPAQMGGVSGVIAVGGGSSHSLAVKSDGTTWAWGSNSAGQLGDGTSINRTAPVQVGGLSGVIAVGAGSDYSLAVKSNGVVWAWGSNKWGQLGDGTTINRPAPVQVSGLNEVIAVRAGSLYSQAVKSDGTIWAWGSNTVGQLGDGTTINRAVPAQVSGLSGVIAVGGGFEHSVALKSDGTVWAWGSNNAGQLGDGTTINRTVPVQVNGLSGVIAVGGGYDHSLAVKSDGTVWAWGSNYAGQLGDGTTTYRTAPIQVNGLSGVIAVGGGSEHSLALKSDGTVWTWGYNYAGQLGDGTTIDRTVPVQVSGLSGAIAVGTGTDYSLALKSDGTVWAWGSNGSGRLGDGTTMSRTTPVQVSGLSGVIAVGAGSGHSLAVKGDGTMCAWGGVHLLGIGGFESRASVGTVLNVNAFHSVALVAMVSPENHSVLVLGSSVDLELNLAPGFAPVTKVEFYNESTKIGESTQAPWNWEWTPNTWGEFHLSAIAIDAEGNRSLSSNTVTVTVPYDSDSDGLPDWWELKYFGELGTLSGGDADGDGLTNLQEFLAGTNPFHADTDGDGMSDDWEVANNSNPLVANENGNPDGDDYSNLEEFIYGLNPNQADPTATVAAGDGHTLILRADGTVWAVGRNDDGQLGVGTTISLNSVASVSSLSGVKAIAAAGGHSLALQNDGTVWAWGRNASGELGDGTQTGRTTPVQVSGLTNIVAIAAGYYHNLAIKDDGTLWAWGFNDEGQVGDGTVDTRTVPVQLSGMIGIKAIAAGFDHSFALMADNTVKAWGHNGSGQLGDGTRSQRLAPVAVSGLSGVKTVVAGHQSSAALKIDGTVLAWGDNSMGQLGNETTPGELTPMPVSVVGIDVKEISAGYAHLLAVKKDGTIWTWGYSSSGQTLDGKLSEYSLPAEVPSLRNIRHAAAGEHHSVFLKSDGTVVSAGLNSDGQMGDGTTALISGAQEGVLRGVRAVSAKIDHSLFAKRDGSVWATGRNEYGQIGDGTLLSRETPVPVEGLTEVVDVAAGVNHSLALKADGTVWAWGFNADGRLGDATTTQRVAPVQSQTSSGAFTNAKGVWAGDAYSLILKTDGTVWGFGGNHFGQLGDGTNSDRTTAVSVLGLVGVKTVAIGEVHNLALRNDGTVWSWGYNGHGELGLGSGVTGNINEAQQIPTLSGVTAIVAGGNHSLALKGDGTVWAWGYNSAGQLGASTPAANSTPTQVAGLTDVVAIGAGLTHSVALRADGTLLMWGSNGNGQLGTALGGFSAVPVQIPGGEGVRSLYGDMRGTIGLKEDGTVRVWGCDWRGSLATGAPEARTAPTALLGINTFYSVPAVTITTPATATTVALGQSEEIISNISSSDVQKIEFYQQNHKVAEISGGIWTWNYVPETWGAISLSAVAIDSKGNKSKRGFVPAITVPYDSDSDTAADWWELALFGHLGESPSGSPALDPEGNADGDSLSNIEEWELGLDPLNPSDAVGEMVVVSGDKQTVAPLQVATQPVRIHVTDYLGRDMAGESIRVRVAEGDGMVRVTGGSTYDTFADLTTDGFGMASIDCQAGNLGGAANRVIVEADFCPTIKAAFYTSGWLGIWEFDEGTGTTSADLSGFNRKAILTGASWTSGQEKSALLLTSTNEDIITIENSSGLDIGAGSFTGMIWLKTVQTTQSRIAGQGFSSDKVGYAVDLGVGGAGRLSFAIGMPGVETSVRVTTVTAFNDGQWHHVAFVVDRALGTIGLLVDGVRQNVQVGDIPTGTPVTSASISAIIPETSEDQLFLGWETGTETYSDISIDGFKLYRGTLTDLAIAAEAAPLVDSDEDGLPDLWEQQIVDADPADDIEALEDVLPNDDFDGDGVANIDEYVAGTSPLDFYNGISPMINVVSGNHQTGSAGVPLTLPVFFDVSNREGWRLSNAPVYIQPVEPAATVGESSTVFSGTLELRTTDFSKFYIQP